MIKTTSKAKNYDQWSKRIFQRTHGKGQNNGENTNFEQQRENSSILVQRQNKKKKKKPYKNLQKF